ncbi:hypothetical protein [Rheinheimera baltica]|uniref:hypothetical protein n=1 Tax=Rheinheimera baltica TaxID=67576 RepID=UPI00273D25A6|nr:hypothetical protein [Rheinheimera baltica]MDP5189997.1 hypothetical protein [Rheinheimera baltica]
MMYSQAFFKIAALKIEQKYTNSDNSELLLLFDFTDAHDVDVEELENLIVDFIEGNLADLNDILGDALFALGKSYKSDYRDLYLRAMQDSVEHNIHICYQAGISIENLGEQVFFSISPTEDKVLTSKRAKDFLIENGL